MPRPLGIERRACASNGQRNSSMSNLTSSQRIESSRSSSTSVTSNTSTTTKCDGHRIARLRPRRQCHHQSQLVFLVALSVVSLTIVSDYLAGFTSRYNNNNNKFNVNNGPFLQAQAAQINWPSPTSSRLPTTNAKSHHQHQANLLPKFNICHVPESQLNQTKCSAEFESQFKRGALADFQAQLSESSLELRNLISSYWLDFRHHSLDLIRYGQRQTRTRILNEQLKTPARSKMPDWMYSNWIESSWRLYDTMISHLNSSLQTSSSNYEMASQQQQHQQAFSNNGQLTSEQLDLAQMSLNELNSELNSFVRRLHLMQAKYLLDQRLEPIDFNDQNQMDLECLSANLISRLQVDGLINELIGFSSLTYDSQSEWSRRQAIVVAEQTQVTQSIRQSLEFARTLLSSLTLAREMFNNLTQRTIDWMPHSSCHNALARMTLCPQCSAQYGRRAASSKQALVPCENYCLNVLRGCMNDIYELNRFWNEHVNLLARFKSNMIQMNNIENVMSNLDDNLVTFIMRLAQQTSISSISQLHSSTTTSSSSSSLNNSKMNHNTTTTSKNQQQDVSIPLGNISRQMVRLCNLRSGSASKLRQQQQQTHYLQAAAKQSAASRLYFAGSGSAVQLRPLPLLSSSSSASASVAAAASDAAANAAFGSQTASQSLFNKLDSFVHQLQTSRSFFATWPERLCRKLRQPQTATLEQQPPATGQTRYQRTTSAANETTQQTSVCWNGIDFSGSYTKPLASFGQPITSNHPEVPKSHSDPFNLMVLNFVARLKYIGAQLARKSVRSPQMSILHSLPPETLATLVNNLVPQSFVSDSVSTGNANNHLFGGTRTATLINRSGSRHVSNGEQQHHYHQTSHHQSPAGRSIKQNATATLEILSAVGSELDSISSNGSPNSDDDIESADSSFAETPSNSHGAHPTPIAAASTTSSASKNQQDADQHGATSANNQHENYNHDDTSDDPEELEGEEEEVEDDLECSTPDCSDLLTRTTLVTENTSLPQTSGEDFVDVTSGLPPLQGPDATIQYEQQNSPPMIATTNINNINQYHQQSSQRYPSTMDPQMDSFTTNIMVHHNQDSTTLFSRPTNNNYHNHHRQQGSHSSSSLQFLAFILIFSLGGLVAIIMVGLLFCSRLRANCIFKRKSSTVK